MPLSSNRVPEPFRPILWWVAVVAWAGLIWAASSRPDLRVASNDLFDLILRKAAHLVVFGVLALLLMRAQRCHGMAVRLATISAWIVTGAYAFGDEWHQAHVPGRVGHARDVAIDMIGATLALAWSLHRADRVIRWEHTI